MASVAATLSIGLWLSNPSIEYVVSCALATAGALLATPRLAAAQRRWATSWDGLLVAAIIIAISAQKDLHQVSARWDGYRATVAARGRDALQRELDVTARELVGAAHAALDAPHDRDGAFVRLRHLARGADERGIVLYRGRSAIAWGGLMRSSPDSLREAVGVISSPFYLTLYASAIRGTDRAVATALVDAAPPGDAFSESIAGRIASRAGLRGFVFSAPSHTPPDRETVRVMTQGVPLLDVRPTPLLQGEAVLRLEERARIRVAMLLAGALACFIIAVWRGTHRIGWRLGALAAVMGFAALVPFNEFSNSSRLFDAALYFTPIGGPLTASAGALGIASALTLLALLAVLRRHRRRPSSWVGATVILLVAVLGPFLLRDLARGVQTPTRGVTAGLWLMWEIPLFLAAASALLAGAAAGGAVLGRSRGLSPLVAPLMAAAAAGMGPMVWRAPGQWPWWYTLIWIAVIAALALARETRYIVLTAAIVAALGATTLVWARTAKGRVALAEQDLASLTQTDSTAVTLLDRFRVQLGGVAPATKQALLQYFVSSDLSSAAYPTALFSWPTDSAPSAAFRTAAFAIPLKDVADAVKQARRSGRPVARTLAGDPAEELLLAVPAITGGVTAIIVAPKTRLIASDPFARLLGIDADPESEPPYTLQLGEPAPLRMARGPVVWRRDRSALHGDTFVRTGAGASRAHLEVELRPIDALVQRGALIALLDVALAGALWVLSVLADGGVGRWLQARRRTWGRSYRTRLTLVLFAFFVIPAVVFAIWSSQQLSADATQRRELLVRERLRAAVPLDTGTDWVAREGDRLDTPLFLYRNGELTAASDPLYEALAPTGRFLDPTVDLDLVARDEVTYSRVEPVGTTAALFGYRAVVAPASASMVLAAPARADELVLGRRRQDLGILVLFTTAVGALAALWLSGVAARQLARPIGALREAALALAGGDRLPPLGGEPTVEFRPVFTAFRTMAADLNASRSALEEAQRRTAAVLRNVASGVIAVDASGAVSLANPRAESLLEISFVPGQSLRGSVPAPLGDLVESFLASAADEEDFTLDARHQQLRGRVTRLGRGGAVVTIDDVTDLARAQRVLAWGEMARQVAHEIKNPLTPIRLGVQHLKRARADARVDFDRVLDQNVGRILTEIDRLDEIARAFSRYGSPPEDRAPAVPTDVAAVVRDVVSLESMDEAGSIRWGVEGADHGITAMARADELRDVLLNVFENARLADATAVAVRVAHDVVGKARGLPVTIAVQDNGNGIPETVLPRIFEPHFSTRTSGSGLGLAISRQIVGGWGGDIRVDSAAGTGTTVEIRLLSVED